MRNDFERNVAKQLKKRKKEFSYESRTIPYVLSRKYVPDFVVVLSNRILYIECKGYLRVEDKSKLKAVTTQHPEMDLRILFDSERNYNKNAKWCEKNKIPCSWGGIPKEWLR